MGEEGETNLHSTTRSLDYRIYMLYASYLKLSGAKIFYKRHEFLMYCSYPFQQSFQNT